MTVPSKWGIWLPSSLCQNLPSPNSSQCQRDWTHSHNPVCLSYKKTSPFGLMNSVTTRYFKNLRKNKFEFILPPVLCIVMILKLWSGDSQKESLKDFERSHYFHHHHHQTLFSLFILFFLHHVPL